MVLPRTFLEESWETRLICRDERGGKEGRNECRDYYFYSNNNINRNYISKINFYIVIQ